MISIGTTTLTFDKSISPRPILPEQSRYPIFTHFHHLCHSNWKSTSRMILARFTWPNAQRTLTEWCYNCLTCQQMKITRHIHPPTRQGIEAVAPFYPRSHGYCRTTTCHQQFAILITRYLHRPQHKLD